VEGMTTHHSPVRTRPAGTERVPRTKARRVSRHPWWDRLAMQQNTIRAPNVTVPAPAAAGSRTGHQEAGGPRSVHAGLPMQQIKPSVALGAGAW
jgi:hypothetical protein